MLSKRFFMNTGAILCSLMLAACSRYAVYFNETNVYTPPSLFTEYKITDTAFSNCVEKTIEDQRVTAADQLARLNCSSAGIDSLEGLGTFSQITELNLANNDLTQVDRLQRLPQLRVLILRDNDLRSVSPLLKLVHLKRLDLSGNPDVDCTDVEQLTHLVDELAPPEHCSTAP